MKTLNQLYIIATFSLSISMICAEEVDISNFVDNTFLGRLLPDSKDRDVSDSKLLATFVRTNPRLPDELRDRDSERIYISSKYPTWAIISVRSGANYKGFVHVTFNEDPQNSAQSGSNVLKINTSWLIAPMLLYIYKFVY